MVIWITPFAPRLARARNPGARRIVRPCGFAPSISPLTHLREEPLAAAPTPIAGNLLSPLYLLHEPLPWAACEDTRMAPSVTGSCCCASGKATTDRRCGR